MVLLIHQKSTVIFIEGGHSPPPDRTMKRLLTFVSATERSRLSPNLVVE